MLVPVLVAVAIGIAIALQAAAVSSLAGTIHPLAISLALLAAGIAVATVWASIRKTWPDAFEVVGHWWWLPLGVAGWAIVAALGWTVARLGVATALSLIVGAQLTAALLIDVGRGSATMGWRAAAGVALVGAGATLLTTHAGPR